jgi:hypothetical protein
MPIKVRLQQAVSCIFNLDTEILELTDYHLNPLDKFTFFRAFFWFSQRSHMCRNRAVLRSYKVFGWPTVSQINPRSRWTELKHSSQPGQCVPRSRLSFRMYGVLMSTYGSRFLYIHRYSIITRYDTQYCDISLYHFHPPWRRKTSASTKRPSIQEPKRMLWRLLGYTIGSGEGAFRFTWRIPLSGNQRQKRRLVAIVRTYR